MQSIKGRRNIMILHEIDVKLGKVVYRINSMRQEDSLGKLSGLCYGPILGQFYKFLQGKYE